ncbi:MAG: hypothetical protein WBC15_24345 [Mycobacterium sp.]
MTNRGNGDGSDKMGGTTAASRQRAVLQVLRGFADVARLAVLVTAIGMLFLDTVEGAFRFGFIFMVLLAFRRADLPAPLDAAVCVTLPLATSASVFGWYREIVWMDVLFHFGNTGVLAAAVYLLLIRTAFIQRPQQNSIANIVLQVTMVGVTMGVLWEFYEWFVRTFTSTHIGVGYADTIADLALDLLGSLLAGVAVAVLRRKALA